MFFEVRLLAALASHTWQQEEVTQECTACGLRIPAKGAARSYDLRQVPPCPGAPSEPDEQPAVDQTQPAEQ